MTKLIVSVRSREEAILAREAGAHLIDIKEPKRGSLGFASDATVATIKESLQSRLPVSVALGELIEPFPYDLAKYSEDVSFVKVGLSRCQRIAWQPLWMDRLRFISSSAKPVAVIYADYERAQSPEPLEILAHASDVGCGALLIDTFVKDGRKLIDLVSSDMLKDWLDLARSSGMATVLAGSLDPPAIRSLLEVRPDYFAVRGAACRGCRDSALDAGRIKGLVGLLHGS